jgi:hypothetical protein
VKVYSTQQVDASEGNHVSAERLYSDHSHGRGAFKIHVWPVCRWKTGKH